MGEETPHGQSRPKLADLSGESGWITTEVAARALRVSPRTIRRYIEQGRLEAKLQGEGVRREWLVSVDSLHALRATRTFEEPSPDVDHANDVVAAAATAANIADVLREMAARLERRAEEVAELRVRLEITERAQSTLEDERRQALEELAEARRRQEEIEQERDELRRELEALKESHEEPSESPESPGPNDAPPEASAEAQEPTERQEVERRGWLRRFFGL
jgi:septal ring factor EnvC (AmiA/AmiB activator)